MNAFESLKEKLISTPIISAPYWELPFELMCIASDYVVSVVLGQTKNKVFHAIYYARITLNDARLNYATTENELLAIVFALDKFRAYLIWKKVTVFTYHSTIKYLMTKKDDKPRFISLGECSYCKNSMWKSNIRRALKTWWSIIFQDWKFQNRCKKIKFRLIIHSTINKY